MKDPLEDIELELQRLRPSDPDPALTERIESQLAKAQPRVGRSFQWPAWPWWVPVTGGAALLLAVILFRAQQPLPITSAPVTKPAYGPQMSAELDSAPRIPAVASPADKKGLMAKAVPTMASAKLQRVNEANYLLGTQDDGVVYASATTPLRKVRCQFLATAQWKEENDNTTVEVIVPAEATLLVPMNVH